MRHGFWPRCQAEGSIITKAGEVNFEGRAFFVHALQGMKPHHAGRQAIALFIIPPFADHMTAAKWNFVNFQSPSYSAVMMEYTTPPSYGSTIVNVGGIATDGEILCAGSRGNSVEHTKVKSDRENEWPEPIAVNYVWGGVTKDKKPVSATLAGSLGKRLDKVDVMAKIPGFIKTIVGGVVGTKPYIYQVRTLPSSKHDFSVSFADHAPRSMRHSKSSPSQSRSMELRGERKGNYSRKRLSFLDALCSLFACFLCC